MNMLSPYKLILPALTLAVVQTSSAPKNAQEHGNAVLFAMSSGAATPPGEARSEKTSAYAAKTDSTAPLDEAMGGRTLLGTPVTKRTPECFPAEPRDFFREMDKVASGPNGELQPLNFDADGDGKISDKERDAIRGRNTWLLWGGGNEVFWGWLQEKGYGLNDFLILMDSRRRDTRFRDAGIINQPGFVSNSDPNKRILGLYLDLPDGEKVNLVQPADDVDEQGQPVTRPQPPPGHPTELFKPGDRELYEKTRSALARDGLDTTIYGYPSGIFGLRLFLNPDFFGDTPAAAKARQYWDARVTKPTQSNYYTDVAVHADPKLVRPFRVSMSCGFCHVAPHPLNPPADPNHPDWANLSSIIGDQYWRPQPAFANLLTRNNFLHHFLASQQPGTVDTSLVSTDWINNPNTINAIFDLPARLVRAAANSPEHQSAANLLVPSIEERDASVNPRHFPRVLVDGSDSCGTFAALVRVPLNIGTYFEEWRRATNPIIGFARRRPFRIAVCQANSVYWKTNERYRVPYEAAFFTLKNKAGQNSTGAMKLKDAVTEVVGADGRKIGLGQAELAKDSPQKRAQGREAFIQHCAICHSSKQPEGFQLDFSRDMAGGWEKEPRPPDSAGPHYTLPMDFAQWDAFKRSDAYADYRSRITALAGPAPADGAEDPFIRDNFLSSEIRIPVSLVGSNPGRATATNALRGEVWDNFSSDDYKNLPAVGPLRYFDPFSGATSDSYGNNASYSPGGGGRGYYRPASLISLWATAPYLHNNALGLYNHDPSVEGRLKAYQDGIEKLLWKDKRAAHSVPGRTDRPEGSILGGDLRAYGSAAAARDTGYIYRLPVDTSIYMAPPFIRQLMVGVLGGFLTSALETWIWVLLFLVLLFLAFRGRQRHATFVFVLLAVFVGALLVFTGFASVLGWYLWLVPIVLVAIALGFFFWRERPWAWNPVKVARIVFALIAAGTLVIGILAHQFINGRLGPLNIGPIPRGTPVNLIMNMDPDSPRLLNGLVGLARGVVKVRKDHLTGDKAYDAFIGQAGAPMMRASKCPDFVLDRGHYFGEALTNEEKNALIAFLKTL